MCSRNDIEPEIDFCHVCPEVLFFNKWMKEVEGHLGKPRSSGKQ